MARDLDLEAKRFLLLLARARTKAAGGVNMEAAMDAAATACARMEGVRGEIWETGVGPTDG